MEPIVSQVVSVFGANAIFLVVGWLVLYRALKVKLEADKATTLEQLRSQLALEAQRLAHDQQIARVKAEAAHSQKHVVYPKLFDLLRRAEGAAEALWGVTETRSYEGYGTEDFEKLLTQLGLPSTTRAEHLARLANDRERGVKKLEETVRRVELRDGRRSVRRASKYLVLKALYMPRAVKAAAFSTLEHFNVAWAQMDSFNRSPSYMKEADQKWAAAMEAGKREMEALEELLRKELAAG